MTISAAGQACSSLRENGVTTVETWRKLLGDQLPQADLIEEVCALPSATCTVIPEAFRPGFRHPLDLPHMHIGALVVQ